MTARTLLLDFRVAAGSAASLKSRLLGALGERLGRLELVAEFDCADDEDDEDEDDDAAKNSEDVTATKAAKNERSKKPEDEKKDVEEEEEEEKERRRQKDDTGAGGGDGFYALLTGPRTVVLGVRGYRDGTLTVSLEYRQSRRRGEFLGYKEAQKLAKAVEQAIGATRSSVLVPLKRGCSFERYFPTADERLLEYDVDELVYERRSPYQKVQIFHSRSLGNMLVLDDNQNMSEADLIYTETLMQRGKESYAGKEIVILGGGDGGLLWELLKEKPKHVTMLELDEVVMEGCSRHMRSVCGDSLDKRKGENYEIIVGDCFATLAKMANEGRRVDYVFGDLTEIPISAQPHGDDWNFVRLVLDASLRVLKPSGKFMTHGNSAAQPEALAMFEAEIEKLDVSLDYTMHQAYIPSFYEEWVFYQLQRSRG